MLCEVSAEHKVLTSTAIVRTCSKSSRILSTMRSNTPRRVGAIQVRLQAEDGKIIVEVSDNGAGIPSHALPHVFEHFYRADKARSRASGGAGLGLSIVKAMCAAHGAGISVTSEEGRGSCFRVEFPPMAASDNKEATTALRGR
jgi:signal transduction histidine kinase